MDRLAEQFAFNLKQMHLRLGGSVHVDIESLARALWLGLGEGHVALPDTLVKEVVGNDPQAFDALQESPVVQRDNSDVELDDRPIVFGYGQWYLQRYALLEKQVCAVLKTLNKLQPIISECSEAAVAAVASETLNHEQAVAVSHALSRQLLVLTGGPGTGKTYTLAAIVNALRNADSRVRIAACAPTGKAALRLEQSGVRFDSVTTIQKLLRSPRSVDNYLDYDVLIVDEASMMDASLAAHLLASIAPSSRLILAGDKNQLNAVRAGAVFSEACTLASATVELIKTQRFAEKSIISTLAIALLNGQVDVALTQRLDWVARPALAPAQLQRAWRSELLKRFTPLFAAIKNYSRNEVSADTVLSELERFKALAATHEGPVGTVSGQSFMAAQTRALSLSNPVRREDSSWYIGRVIAVTKNDDELTGLRNGDVGICLMHENQLRAVFRDGAHSIRWVALGSLPAHEDGWVLTVHKSQGSEYVEVLFAVPPQDSPQCRRELVYTAITRARVSVALLGNPGDLIAAAKKPTERFSGLKNRLNSASEPVALK